MIVVSDTSPILNLRRINRLELLAALYGHVVIPPAVRAELRADADTDLLAHPIAGKSWEGFVIW